jgi:hypothetical protein
MKPSSPVQHTDNHTPAIGSSNQLRASSPSASSVAIQSVIRAGDISLS